MRKLLMLLPLFLFALNSQVIAQDDKDDNDKEVATVLKFDGSGHSYEEVITIPNVTQADLFKRAKTWILANMQTDDNNIAFDEKEGTINNTGAMKIDRKLWFTSEIKEGVFNFKFHVWIKEGKYKFKIDNVVCYLVVHEKSAIAPRTYIYNELKDDKRGKYLKNQVNQRLAGFIASYKKGMAGAEKNDW